VQHRVCISPDTTSELIFRVRRAQTGQNCIQPTSFLKGGNGTFISDTKETKYVAYSDK